MSLKSNKRTELGKVLAKLRVDLDQTSAEMAEKLEISVSSLSAYEYGRSQPMADFATKVLHAYGCDVTHLVAKKESRPKRMSFLSEHLTEEEFAFALRMADAVTRRAKGEEVPCLVGKAISEKLDGDVATSATTAKPAKPKPKPVEDVDGVDFISEEEMEKELEGLEIGDSDLLMA